MISRHRLANRRYNALDLVGHRATIGVAQHDPPRAGFKSRLGARERIIGICLVAVEEVLAIDQHLTALFLGRAHAVTNGRQIFLKRGLKRHAHLIIRGLGDEADCIGLGVEQRRNARIVRDRAARPARHAKGGEGGVSSVGGSAKNWVSVGFAPGYPPST